MAKFVGQVKALTASIDNLGELLPEVDGFFKGITICDLLAEDFPLVWVGMDYRDLDGLTAALVFILVTQNISKSLFEHGLSARPQALKRLLYLEKSVTQLENRKPLFVDLIREDVFDS